MKNFLKKLFLKLIPDKLILIKGNDKNTVYLSFDDGPYDDCIVKIVDILNENKIPATFFLNGESILKFPDIIKKIIKNGGSIGNHSFSHFRPTNFNFIKSFNEIKLTNNAIKTITNNQCRIYRPPYGKLTISDFLYAVYNNFKIVLWSYDSKDSFAQCFEEIENTLNNITGGDILLFHNDSKLTANNLNKIINIIDKKGFNFGLIIDI